MEGWKAGRGSPLETPAKALLLIKKITSHAVKRRVWVLPAGAFSVLPSPSFPRRAEADGFAPAPHARRPQAAV